MGSGVVQLFTLLPHSSSPLGLHPTGQYNAHRSSFSIKAGGRVGGSEWEGTQNGRSKYHEQFGYDEEEFGFANTRKQRNWWSDDSSPSWDTDADEDEDELLDGLGILEGSIGFSSVFKILRAFGWLVPAVVISMLLGTGTNAFVMALVLPLSQSALSLVFDVLSGRSTASRKPKSRSHKRKGPFAGASGGSRMRDEKGRSSQNDKSFNDYHQSWVAKKNASAEKGERRAQNFGGWDELDKQGRMEEPKTGTANERIGQAKGKLSRRARNRHTPLLVRLLIAFFPFLGFWTKLF